MSGAVARRVCIPNTISLCLEIGRLLERHGNRLDAFLADLETLLAPTHYGEVHHLCDGKVIDMERRVEGGYDFGVLRIQPFDPAQEPVTIHIKNEYLVALQGDRALATTPDLICLLDIETGRPITAETLRYGQRVGVLAIGAPALMRTNRALAVVSPRNFGLDYDYVPIERASRDESSASQ